MALRKSSLLVGSMLSGLALAPAPAPAQASPSPWTSGARYDAMGRVTGTIAPDPDGAGPLAYAAVRNSYDAAGRLIKVEQGELAAWQSEAVAPAAWTGFTVHRVQATVYDNMGRKTREVLSAPDGTVRAVTQHGYDALGRLECTAVRMNPALWPNAAGAGGSLPASACTPGAAGTGGNDFGPDRIVRNLYDAAGQRLQLRVGVGTPVEGAQASWAYNLNGQVTTLIDGNGNRAEMRYDGHGRQDRWTFPSATRPASFDDSTPAQALATAGAVNAADHEAYGYDANGNRTSLRKRDGSELTFQYDALNRMTVKVVPERPGLAVMHTRDVHYAYDLRGLMTHARFDSLSGEGVTTQYDGFGRVISSSLAMGGATRTLAYQYDRNSNRTRVTHPDGQYFTYAYDGLNRMNALSENGATGLLTQAYHPNGSRAAMVRGGASSSFDYDDVGRLDVLGHDLGGTTHDVAWSYAYNPASQVRTATRDNDAYAWTGHYGVARAYTTNGLNQYTTAGAATFAYDANGNLTSDGTRTYAYDIENRLVGAGSVVLRYDPLGRLWQLSGGVETTRRFLYDGDALVSEYNPSNVLVRRYVHGSGVDEPLIWYEGAGVSATSRRQLAADRQGSIVAVANASGATIAANAYDEYGIPQSTNLGRFQYTGQIWIPDLGMYHYKARVYSPALGRFLQADPVGYEDQFNLYAYVGNDPLNFVDATGKRLRPVLPIPLPAPLPFPGGVPPAARPPTPERIQQDLQDLRDTAAALGDAVLCGTFNIAACGRVGDRLLQSTTGPDNPAPEGVQDQIPEGWGEGRPTDDGGWAWPAPGRAGQHGDGVRWSPGNPEAPGENAREGNVKVTSGGRRLTQDGTPSTAREPRRENDAHIPDREYENWRAWNRK